MLEQSIVQGFKLTALACLLLCSSAVVLVCLMRLSGRKRGMALAAQGDEQALPASSEQEAKMPETQ